MQNDEIDRKLEPLVEALRELPAEDARGVNRVLARVRQDDALPGSRRRALKRHVLRHGGWWAAAATLLLAAGAGVLGRSGSEGDAAAYPPPPAVRSAAFESDAASRLVSREFAIESVQASQVALVGDFNQWNPERHRLHRDDSGRWYITVRLSAGLHRYAFIVDDSVWTPDPDAVRTIDRDFGMASSLVLVQ